MKLFTLSVGSTLRLDGVICKVTNKLNEETLELFNLTSGDKRYVDRSHILAAYNRGEVEFLDEEEIDLLSESENELDADFSSYSEAEKAGALRRIAYVEAAEEISAYGASASDKKRLIASVAMKIGDKKPPESWLTVYRWQKQYFESGNNIISLIGKTRNRGNRTKRFDERSEDFIQKAIEFYLVPEKPSIKFAYKRLMHLAWKTQNETGRTTSLPSYDAFRKRIHNLDRYLVMVKRFGKRIADIRFTAYKKGSFATRPLELVEIDHTPIDMMVVDEQSRLPLGRPTLTSLIDKFSRMVIGFYLSFTPPSTLSVIECLRHAILPKDGLKDLYPALSGDWPAHGIPETIMVDNGKEFLSNDFTEITRSLGINIIRSPVKNPHYKGAVERHFRAVADDLLKGKPGKTFSNIFEKGEYDPKKHAVISLSSLVEITHLWIVDQVNNSVNDGINTTPLRMWESAISWYPVRLPKSINFFNLALGKTLTRTIQHYGIEFESLRYNSDELSLLRRKHDSKVIIKYDPNDISKIYVLDPSSQNKYITVPCNDQIYARKTLFQHQLIKKFNRRLNLTISVENLMRAEDRIIEIIESEKALTKKIRRASKQARFKDISQKTKQSQALPGEISQSRTLENLSLFNNGDFDPYDSQKREEPVKINSSFLEGDDDLDDLYADDPNWHASYSRENPDK